MLASLSWPESQRFVGERETTALASRCEPGFTALCRRMRITEDLRPYLGTVYVPLAAWLQRRRTVQREGLVVGLCGAQGSGKSTLTALLASVLREGLSVATARFSLDDLYKTRAERQALAAAVHPLFRTRGVPGTHDVTLGVETLEQLRTPRPGQRTALPSFDKATDTRRERADWPVFEGRADVILFEGWCVGALPQSPGELLSPVNRLEREEDPEGTWRTRANEALAGEYRALFDRLDVLILLEVASMERVFEWRRLQERKLGEQMRGQGVDPSSLRIMSEPEVDRFVMHYERLTRHILAEMPGRADIVLGVDGSHQISRVRINHPLPVRVSSRERVRD